MALGLRIGVGPERFGKRFPWVRDAGKQREVRKKRRRALGRESIHDPLPARRSHLPKHLDAPLRHIGYFTTFRDG